MCECLEYDDGSRYVCAACACDLKRLSKQSNVQAELLEECERLISFILAHDGNFNAMDFYQRDLWLRACKIWCERYESIGENIELQDLELTQKLENK